MSKKPFYITTPDFNIRREIRISVIAIQRLPAILSPVTDECRALT